MRGLLDADQDRFDAAVAEIDRRLRAEIRERQRHRTRIAQLAAGDSLVLPPEAVAYLARLRDLGFVDEFVDAERDAWILVAAKLPQQMPLYMRLKQQQLDEPANLALLRDLAEAVAWHPDDPRLVAVCDRLVGLLDEAHAAEPWDPSADGLTDDLVALLDGVFLEKVPAAPRVLELLEARGWRGWTRLERIDRTVG